MDDAHSMSNAQWILAPLLLQNVHYADVRILLALPIDIDEISAIFPDLIENNTTVEWDENEVH